jgi:hypothetical protein
MEEAQLIFSSCKQLSAILEHVHVSGEEFMCLAFLLIKNFKNHFLKW